MPQLRDGDQGRCLRESGEMVDHICPPPCGAPFKTRRTTSVYCSIACSNKATSQAREDKLYDEQPTIVWSCGGGVDSTAIAALICEGRLPKPHLSLMIDVGYEPRSTWEQAAFLQEKLSGVGVALNIIRTVDYTNNDLVRDGWIVVPAYRRMDGTRPSKLHTRCSGRWKLEVAKKWMREQGVKRAANWVGIAADEARRVRPSRHKWLDTQYPLVSMGMTREDCIHLIASTGWPMPPRTSCYLCPNRTQREWSVLAADEPDDFNKACEAERELQRADATVYLHPSCIPLREWVEGNASRLMPIELSQGSYQPCMSCVL